MTATQGFVLSLVGIIAGLAVVAGFMFGIPQMIKMSGDSKSEHQIACLKNGGSWVIATDDCVNVINQPQE